MSEGIKLDFYYELESSKSFEKDYCDFLMKVEENGVDYKYSVDSYIDPDSVNDVKKISFYNHLTCFLNHQEKENRKKYVFLPPSEAPTTKWEKKDNMYDKRDEKKITVIQDSDVKFRLTSDQFGFSAAETIYNSNKYPLSQLLNLYKNSGPKERNKVKNRITQYVKNTRTIGGSFLWPVPPQGKRNCYYNTLRGRYLEDRVDLTLLEIKHALDRSYDNGEYTSDILYSQYRKNTTYIKTWLEHFESFDKYVEYFKLESFVKDRMPINIVEGGPLNDDYIKEYREQYKGRFLQNMTAEKICKMLNRLEIMILKRSKKMEKIIKQYTHL